MSLRGDTIAERPHVRSRTASFKSAVREQIRSELRVFGSSEHGQAVLVARLDNLGKGASGAAVQNIGLMLGIPVETRLPAAAP